MRPLSAQKPKTTKPNQDSKLRATSRYRKTNKQHTHDRISVEQQSMSNLYSTQKPHMLRLKTLGLLQAYRPGLLKECLVSEEKGNLKKYASGGQCNLNDIFIKTALNLFRDWREKINAILTLLIDAVTDSDEVLEPALQEKIKAKIDELKQYSIKIKEQLQELSSNDNNYKVLKLREKYVLLLETMEHVLKLVDCMRSLSSEVVTFLQLKKDSGVRDAQVQAGVKNIAEKYEMKAADSLNYCACHPDNQLLLRLQFKARRMFLSSTDKVKAIFQSIRQLQVYEANFKKQMLFLENFQDFSHEYLGHVLELLYSKNEEIKIIQKKYQVSKMPEFVQLRERIEDWETNFIKKLRSKSIAFFKQTLDSLNNTRTLHLIRSKGKQYKQLKKMIVLLGKVYQQSEKESNIGAQYYQFEKKSITEVMETLNQLIIAISPSIQQLQQKIEEMQSVKDKGSVTGMKLVQKQSGIIQAIEKAQSIIWGLMNTVYLKLNRIDGLIPQIIQQKQYTDKISIQKLHSLVFFSRNQQQNNEIFKQLRRTQQKTEDIIAIIKSYDNRYKMHLQFAKEGLQLGLERARQLKDILKQQLIGYLFREEYKGELILFYFIIKQVYLMESKVTEAAGKNHINGTLFYRYTPAFVEDLRRAVNECIKKIDQSKHKTILNRYIILIYECIMLQLLNTSHINTLFVNQADHLQPYRAIFHEYVQTYEGSLIKSRREETSFGILTAKIYSICSVLNTENRLICQYNDSRSTNQYYPSCSYLSQWLMLQFSAQVQETINKSKALAKREEVKTVFDQFTKKLQAQRQKFKLGNPKAEQKEIYKRITANIGMLRQFNFTQDYKQLLLKLIRYLQLLNEPHTAIFTKDKLPISIIITTATQQQVNSLIFSMLGLGQQNKNKSIIQPFNFTTKAEVIENQPSTPINIINKAKVDQEIVDEIPIQQYPMDHQIVDQLVEEEVIQVMQNLPVSSVVKPPAKSQQPSQQMSITSKQSQLSFHYFKINQIQNLSQLKNCLYYHNNQFFTIQSKLKLDVLCQAFKPKGRNIAIKLLKELLDEVSKNDIIRLMKLSEAIPECEYHLIQLLQLLQKNHEVREQLLSVLSYFKVERTVIYQQKKNFIECFRKQNERMCFLNANLTENCYRANIRHFKIEQIVTNIWNTINTNQASDSSTALNQINRCIDTSNRLLMGHFQQIESRFNLFKQNHMNRKQIEEQVKSFLKQICNGKKTLDYVKVASQRDLVKSLNVLQKKLRQISIVQPFFALKLDDMTLYIDSTQINTKTITNCLLLPSLDDQFNKCITYDKSGSPSTRSDIIRRFIKDRVQVSPLDFGKIETFLNSLDQNILLSESKIKDEELTRVRSFLTYCRLYDPDLAMEVAEVENEAIEANKILQFLLDTNNQKNRRQEYLQRARQILISDPSPAPVKIIYFDAFFLQKLQALLKKSKVGVHRLLYKNQCIALLKEYRLGSSAEKLAISLNRVAQLQKEIIQHEGNTHVIRSLYINLCDIVPSFSGFDSAIQERIKNYLIQSMVEIKQTSQTITFNYASILKKDNCIKVEVAWPKQKIIVKHVSPHSTITLNILPQNYYYYADVKLLVLRASIAKDYQTVNTQYLQDLRRAQEQAHREELNRQEKITQLQRIQQERQLLKLRAEQEKAGLRFGTAELNRKNIEREAEHKIRLKFIQQTTLAKLKEDYKIQQKHQQQSLNNKLNHLSQTSTLKNLNEDYLEFEITLSEGQDERFNEDLHCQKYDVEYDYRMTLYHHIRQTYHSLRKKTVDVEKWLDYY